MSLESVSVNVIENDGNKATVELSWNHNGASYYEAGCVSCIPNFSDDTTQNTMILENVTPFADGDALLYIIAYDDADALLYIIAYDDADALLYIIAYDDADEIISAKQIVVALN